MKKVLIVEDDAVSRAVLVRQLAKHNFAVDWVTSGEEALATIERHVPDLIIIDLTLPGIDGCETMRRIRGTPQSADIPIVVVTARDELHDWVEGYRAGATFYLSKPYHQKQLLRSLESVLYGPPLAEARRSEA